MLGEMPASYPTDIILWHVMHFFPIRLNISVYSNEIDKNEIYNQNQRLLKPNAL